MIAPTDRSISVTVIPLCMLEVMQVHVYMTEETYP
jgi:hypothetical protein